MNIVEIDAQPIELCKLLKIANLVGGGGEAKIVISEGYVFLNGDLETQKRKKIYHNDVIEFNGEAVQVICHSPVQERKVKNKKTVPTEQKTKQPKTQHINEPLAKKGGRRRINL